MAGKHWDLHPGHVGPLLLAPHRVTAELSEEQTPRQKVNQAAASVDRAGRGTERAGGSPVQRKSGETPPSYSKGPGGQGWLPMRETTRGCQ